jgi:hypothetical protein
LEQAGGISSRGYAARLRNGSWEIVGNAPFANENLSSLDIDLDHHHVDPQNGYHDILAVYSAENGNLISVKKLVHFFGGGDFWRTVGQPGFAAGWKTRIAIQQSTGTPFVLFEGQQGPRIFACPGGVNGPCTWQDTGTVLFLSAGQIAQCNRIIFSEIQNDIPLVDCLIKGPRGRPWQIVVRQKTLFGWVAPLPQNGLVGLTNGEIYQVDMLYSRFFDSAFVAYSDALAGNRLSVKKIKF